MSSERERILSLTAGPEMDREVAARLMRLEPVRRKIPCPDGLPGCEVFHFIEEPFPSFSTDYNAVRAMEDEIERRGLLRPYTLEMLGILIDQAETGEAICPQCGRPDLKIRPVEGKALSTLLLRASCPDRCRAALLVVGEKP